MGPLPMLGSGTLVDHMSREFVAHGVVNHSSGE
jgi:hypothetical protein